MSQDEDKRIGKKGRKRTKVSIEKKAPSPKVLHIENMVLNNGKGKNSYFNRLRYFNVPTVKQIATQTQTLANRDIVVRAVYETVQALGNSKAMEGIFGGLVSYFKYIDNIQFQSDIFDNNVMKDCIRHYNSQKEKGQDISRSQLIRRALTYLLSQWGRDADGNALPSVKGASPSTGQAFHVENELKHIATVLVKGAVAFKEAIEKGEFLDTHPFYDEVAFTEVIKGEGWSNLKIAMMRDGFKKCMTTQFVKKPKIPLEKLNKMVFFNHASRNWFFVFSMLTGMNKGPLASITFADVKFKDIGSGRYVFDSVKHRASDKEIDNKAGFSKRTKALISAWIKTSKIMYQELGIAYSKTHPLCPYFDTKGNVLTMDCHGVNLEQLNKQLVKITGVKVNTVRFRATKSDILMRVTEDIFLVSEGLNNTVNVVAKSYSSGVQSDHDSNLNATFSAQMSVAKGETITKAVENAKVMHSDILSDYDYKQRLQGARGDNRPLMKTPCGVRCQGATPEKLDAEARRMKQLGIDFSKDTGRCIDFMGCFDCPSHKLVASENDIWLMLSFSEGISDLKNMVAGNSAPKDEYFMVEATLQKVLIRLNKKAPKNYASAKVKVDSGEFHPLYQDVAIVDQFFKE
ncbi:hypothetical protein [Moritella viscosa]|uniref:Uncharacterized protein n=1 Tax=Moritella viscosa TaxID=80854 RepID=A0A1L0AID4_9GAMM|nr:hypothetical protein [Moritella viscosa]SGZ16705.1 Putative uncharacterized protein [Moritella viscosa]